MSDASPIRTIAIGDIHGCASALRILLDAVAPTADDLIIPLGDVVDRGPDSRRCVEMLLELCDRCQVRPVMGNHEEMMLKVLDGVSPQNWLRYGGVSTLDSYGFVGALDVVPTEHVDFIRSFTDYVELETHFFVHANYQEDLALDEQPKRLLRWESLEGNTPSRHTSGKEAVVGHTAIQSGSVLSLPHLKCIDTNCYGGGWLTAYAPHTGDVWQANEQGQLRKGRLPITPTKRCATA